ncbi:MAG: FtsQ-type POTRA domain-containing protein [Actinomycetota bacterium]
MTARKPAHGKSSKGTPARASASAQRRGTKSSDGNGQRSGWLDGRAAGPRSTQQRLLIVLGSFGVILGLGIALIWSPILRVETISASGTLHTAPTAIVDASGINPGQSMVLLDTGAAQGRIEALPWVATASVIRNWPTGIHLVITERSPVVTTRGPNNVLVAVDGQGRVLGTTTTRLGLPGLSITTPAGGPGTTITKKALPCLEIATSLPVAFRSQVRALVCMGPHVQIVFPGPVVFEVGSTLDLRAKYVAIASLIAKETFNGFDTVDVTDPANVTVTPQPHG